MPRPLKVLLVGASGVFGSRLAELAAGEKDVELTLAARNLRKLESLAARLPDAQRVVVAGAGHMVPISHAPAVATEIRRFWSDHPA